MTEEIHTIGVPHGWSVEQAWEAISRGHPLPDAAYWVNVVIRDGHLIKVAR